MFSWLTYPRTTNFSVKVNCILLPIVSTIILMFWYHLTLVKPDIFGSGSVSDFIFSVFSLLPGFFLAALSAAATFGNKHVDNEIDDKCTKMPFKIGGITEWEVPSKRLIAIYLFYFLLIASLILVVISGIGKFLLSDIFIQNQSIMKANMIEYSFMTVSIFLSMSILFTIGQGMSFFVERMIRLD